jgi:hypothetical protein
MAFEVNSEPRLTKEWLKTIAEKFDYEDYNSQWWTEMFLDRFIDAIVQALPHIPESEKRQKEPGMGVSVDAKTHPDYPIRHGIPAMDRCICGGVRHWHAVAPYGCDDCECTEFTLNENWRP